MKADSAAGLVITTRAVWNDVPRLNRLCTTGASAHSSDSNTVPGASKTPTTRQVWAPKRTDLPISKPWNSRSRPAPTTISLDPGANMRPSRILACLRTSSPLAPTPRSGILALVCDDFLMPSTTINSSPDTTGRPSAPGLTPGPRPSRSTCSRDRVLFSSASEPSRSTIATSGAPEPFKV